MLTARQAWVKYDWSIASQASQLCVQFTTQTATVNRFLISWSVFELRRYQRPAPIPACSAELKFWNCEHPEFIFSTSPCLPLIPYFCSRRIRQKWECVCNDTSLWMTHKDKRTERFQTYGYMHSADDINVQCTYNRRIAHNTFRTSETKTTSSIPSDSSPCWSGGSVVERRSLTGELSLVCPGPAADG